MMAVRMTLGIKIQSLSSKSRSIRGIKLSRNFGQHNALLCGIREANGSFIVTLDDDLQHSPEAIPQLLSKLEEGSMLSMELLANKPIVLVDT